MAACSGHYWTAIFHESFVQKCRYMRVAWDQESSPIINEHTLSRSKFDNSTTTLKFTESKRVISAQLPRPALRLKAADLCQHISRLANQSPDDAWQERARSCLWLSAPPAQHTYVLSWRHMQVSWASRSRPSHGWHI